MGRYRVVDKEEEKLYRDENLEDTKCEDIRKNFFGDCPHAGNQKTPYFLCKEIVDKLPNLNGKNILILFNPELYYVIKKYYDGAKFTFITGSKKMSKVKFKNAKLIYCNPFDFERFSEVVKNMKKFDVIIGNPPYQVKVGPKKTEPIWDKFVEKSFELCKDGGLISLIHPSGWRNVSGRFEEVKKIINKKNLKYLEIHNEKDGLTTFGAETRFDWYVCENLPNKERALVKFQDGTLEKLDCLLFPMIPNKNLLLFESLLAKKGEEKCEVIYARSAYGTDKKWMNKEETDEFKYPCIYTINSKSEPSFFYSSTNTNGHFGVPKVIWSNGRISSIGNFVDEMGEYGLTQFSYAIVDDPNNLNSIKQALDSLEYKTLMEDLAVGMLTVNYKVISLFRKDFWKEFI